VHEERLAAARALLSGLPDGERVAIFEAPAAPEEEASDGGAVAAALPVADLNRDRDHLLARLNAIEPAAGRSAAPAMAGLGASLASVESSFGALHRELIVVGEVPAAEQKGGYQPVAVAWLDESGGAFDADRAYAGWNGDRTPETAAGEILSSIGDRRAAAARVGACPAPGTAPLILHAGGTTCTIAPPEPMSHMTAVPCDSGDAARDAYPYPAEIELTFTDEERAVYDSRYQAASKEDFRTSVRLGAGTPLPGRAHFRGQTSLGCERKSMFVELDGSSPRRLLPGAASDRFLLISMCKDDGYFGQVLGDRVMARLEVFPLHLGYVRVRVDGVNQGVYLLLEHPDRTLVTDLLAPRAVIRRRFDPDGISPEVEIPGDGAAADALARYLALVALAQDGEVAGLDAALERGMDLDGYLTWVALASVLENGDNVDEIFFYASEENEAWWFRVAGWDPDDLFEACHHGGIWALEDTCQLLYCVEGDLDQALLRSAAVYRRFGAALAEIIDALTASTLREMMDQVREDLFAVLDDDETAAAMVELVSEVPSAATAAGAQTEIASRMEAMLQAAEARRQWLIDRLASCPEAAP